LNNKKTLIALVAMQCIYVLFGPFWLYFAMISAMMFDSPGAAENQWLFILFLLIWMYPIGLLAGAIVSWVYYFRRRWTAAWLWNCLPLVWVLPIGSFVVYTIIS